jgi:hypothetical protein
MWGTGRPVLPIPRPPLLLLLCGGGRVLASWTVSMQAEDASRDTAQSLVVSLPQAKPPTHLLLTRSAPSSPSTMHHLLCAPAFSE